MTMQTMLTPKQLAARWDVQVELVLHHIHAGRLVATNVSRNDNGRPRWKIDPAEVTRFEAARSSSPEMTLQRLRRRKHRATNGREYF